MTAANSPYADTGYSFDVANRVTRKLLGNGAHAYYAYDADSRLTGEHWVDSGNQTIHAFSWDYDANGNRTYLDNAAVASYYEYNAANELTRSHELGTGWSYYAYDANGNMTREQGPTGTTYFTYTPANLVDSIHYADGTWNYFHYDGNLRRYALRDSDGLHYLTWDQSGLRLLAVRDASGNLEAEYTHGYAEIDGIGTIASARVLRSSQWEERFYLINHHGDVMAVYDDTTTELASYTYNAWGQRLHATEAAGVTNWFQYQTDWMTLKDSGAELCLSPTRVYVNHTSRFCNFDEFPIMSHMQGYFRRKVCDFSYSGNPLLFVDPTGELLLGISELLRKIYLLLPGIGQIIQTIELALGYIDGIRIGDYAKHSAKREECLAEPERAEVECRERVILTAGYYSSKLYRSSFTKGTIRALTGLLLAYFTGSLGLLIAGLSIVWDIYLIGKITSRIDDAARDAAEKYCKCPESWCPPDHETT